MARPVVRTDAFAAHDLDCMPPATLWSTTTRGTPVFVSQVDRPDCSESLCRSFADDMFQPLRLQVVCCRLKNDNYNPSTCNYVWLQLVANLSRLSRRFRTSKNGGFFGRIVNRLRFRDNSALVLTAFVCSCVRSSLAIYEYHGQDRRRSIAGVMRCLKSQLQTAQ